MTTLPDFKIKRETYPANWESFFNEHVESALAEKLQWFQGTGTPLGNVTASVGAMFLRTDGGANTVLYIKESGTGTAGWVAK